MFDWFKSLADPTFMPHGHCYLWRPEILWTHVISDFIVGVSYFTIPLILFLFLRKNRRKVPYPEILGLFIAFILLCGTTHFLSIVVTWNPLYQFQGWLKAATAIVSLITALALIPRLPKLISHPDALQAYEQSRETMSDLQKKNAQMETIYKAAVDRENRILELKKEVNQLLNQQKQPLKYLDNVQ